ncbi:hypothetical protein Bbelb_315730 [Branchiostoma belcheri]|nr:hypothetical protein Bbelb_315730 [Branchiostoma belcheri]
MQHSCFFPLHSQRRLDCGNLEEDLSIPKSSPTGKSISSRDKATARVDVIIPVNRSLCRRPLAPVRCEEGGFITTPACCSVMRHNGAGVRQAVNFTHDNHIFPLQRAVSTAPSIGSVFLIGLNYSGSLSSRAHPRYYVSLLIACRFDGLSILTSECLHIPERSGNDGTKLIQNY